jgi:hypothetical protein
MFPENVLFDFVLLHLEEEMAGYLAPAPQALPCDRWLARSALQKAIRRGQTEIALSALAALLEQDRYGVWRHLIVIALEDVGVAGMDTVARVVAASRNRPWRKTMRGEWAVASFLVRQMAEGLHCQAACDLLLRAKNCPALELDRTNALDAERAELGSLLNDSAACLEKKGVAALALGGGLAEEQRQRDPATVFDLIEAQGYSSHVVATCRAAWRITRNPMAFLLPLVWQEWMKSEFHEVRDDPIPPVRMIGGVPSYAMDQFTRVGGQVARAYLAHDERMGPLLDGAGIPKSQRPKVLGDLLFLLEGSSLRRRVTWPLADALRLPVRMLPGTTKLDAALNEAMAQLRSNRPLIAQLRSHLYHQMRAEHAS